ncbi:MAG TPA: glucose-6-phosphate isomerase [Bacteroidales bacterium]|nr:glucose-6-phosphate isomerase [Bacteroidales bacterium]
MKQMIKIDISGISDFTENGIPETLFNESIKQLSVLRNGTGRGNDFLGWVNLPDVIGSQIAAIKACASRLKSQADTTVVIGIGGSYLGAKALMEALTDPFHKGVTHNVVFAGHTLSEDYHASLLDFLGNKKFNIVIISKSGTTTEPAIAFRILRDHLKSVVGKEASKFIVAVTDEHKGALHNLSVKEGYQTFIIPDNVGGRYSVLTPVGLLPLALTGLDIDAFVSGMMDMAKLIREGNDKNTNMAIVYAAARNYLYNKGFTTEILVSFEPSLVYLAEWWKQLYGESEGKEGKGIYPSSVVFTTDLHSMGQYIQQGERKIFETMISVEQPRHKLVVPASDDDSDGIGFIAGKALTEVNHKAEAGTRLAHIDGGVPVMTININKIDEYTLGQLMYFFELACGISGYVLDINPFDQPGVESYKKNMFALLGKPGYEAERAELEKKMII